MNIEAAYLLGVDKRKQFWPKLVSDVKELLGLDLRVFVAGDGSDPELVYDHIDLPPSPGLLSKSNYGTEYSRPRHANAFLCHQKMLLECLDKGYQTVFFLEDDSLFLRSRWNKLFPKLANQIQTLIWSEVSSALYLGWQKEEYPGDTEDMQRYEQMWQKDSSWSIGREEIGSYCPISGLHAVIFNRKLMERLVRIPCGPIDSYLNTNVDRFNLWYIRPKIVGCRPCKSECGGHFQPRSILE